MIRFLFGENEFLKRQRLAELLEGAQVEKYDGEELSVGRLQDIFLARTLFGDDRTIVIRDASLNSEVWTALSGLRMAEDSTIIFYETKPDKRTKTYKFLQKQAKTEEFAPFGERDAQKAIQWCTERARKVYDFVLERSVAQTLIERLGMDMGRLDMALGQLALSDDRSAAFLDALVPLPKTESAFELFAAAVTGKREDVHRIISYLEATSGDDGAYQTLGLLASQLLHLNALVLSGGGSASVGGDFGAHPYALRQLLPLAKTIAKKQLHDMNHALGQADIHMKTTNISPWLLVETALLSFE